MNQDWNALVEEGKRIAGRKDKDQWHLGELAGKVQKDYGADKLGQYAQEIGEHPVTLRAYRNTVAKWPIKNDRPGSFSVAKNLNAHPDRFRIVSINPDITPDQARVIMKKWREEQPKKSFKKKNKPESYEGPLNRRAIEEEIRQRVQDGIDEWMVKFRPHLEDAKAIKNGRRGLITKSEGDVIMRCLHPDNSASSETRTKSFIIWKRISHLLMSEQDAPTLINLELRRKRA